MRRSHVVLIPLIVLLLVGCNRQASEPFDALPQQSISNTAFPTVGAQGAPTEVTDEPQVDGQATEVPETPTDAAPTEAATEAATEGVPTETEMVETEEPTEAAPTDLPLVEPTTAAPPTEITPPEVVPTDAPLAEPTTVVPPTEVAPTESLATEAEVITSPTTSGGQQVDPTAIIPATDAEVAPNITPTATEPIIITPGGPSGDSAVATPTRMMTQSPETIGTATPSGLITPTLIGGAVVDDDCVYIVNSGDTLFRIAINNGTTVDAIRAANPSIVGDIIQPGDRITLPDCGEPETQAPAQPTAVTDGGVDTEAPIEDAGIIGSTTGIIHVVQSGETLGSIARRYGLTIDQLVAANNLPDPDRLSVGQELVIPN